MNTFLKKFRLRLKYNPLRSKDKKNKGIALIMAITTLMLMVYVATEVSKDSLTEFAINSQELNRLKVYYAARSGMQIALLRVKIFQQIGRQNLPPQLSKYMDEIWKFPFAWPIPVTGEMSAVDKDKVKDLNKESFMDAQYMHSIEDEGSKIDLNDLASPSKSLQQITKTQLLNIFNQKIETDEEFKLNYQSYQFENLINHIIDWMSDSNTAASGNGDKKSAFSSLGENYPPNRGFRTIDELRLVPGMTDEFFNILAPQITIYGMKAINPNTASKEVLKSLDPSLTDAIVKEVMELREQAPFSGEGEKCNNSLKAAIEQQGGGNRLSAEFNKIPMICDKVINFRIVSNGIFGNGKNAMQKTITTVVMDLSRSAQQVKKSVDADKKNQNNSQTSGQQQGNPNPPPATGTKSGADQQEPLPKGPPRIVYWTES